jgi:hypothetical protein
VVVAAFAAAAAVSGPSHVKGVYMSRRNPSSGVAMRGKRPKKIRAQKILI